MFVKSDHGQEYLPVPPKKPATSSDSGGLRFIRLFGDFSHLGDFAAAEAQKRGHQEDRQRAGEQGGIALGAEADDERADDREGDKQAEFDRAGEVTLAHELCPSGKRSIANKSQPPARPTAG
jgi:hypothetical protein